ncbi:MAG: porin [Acidobacteriota bacterium]|nr:porin [Acidobacteriota bacterium]
MPIAAHRALRTTARGLIAASLLLAFGRSGQSEAQALIKVNDSINFKLGLLLQPQADFQEVGKVGVNESGGYSQNLLIRRVRLLVGGQVSKNVFFFLETENSQLGKSTQTATGTTGVKALGSGFNVLDAVAEWRIAKEFNVQVGEIRVPTSREGLKSSPTQFMLDFSAYAFLTSAATQSNAGRDTGAMARGYFFCDRLEYRAGVFQGFRQPGVKNSYRTAARLQYNFFDTEVYNFVSYAGSNLGAKKILAIGAGYDTQMDYKFASADLYIDFPIPLGAFESTVQYQYANGGNTFATLPQQSTFQIEGGVFLKALKIAPIVRYEQQTFTADIDQPKNQGRVAVGLNFYPRAKAENNFNLKVWWQRVTPKVGFPTNQFTFQMQAYYF